MRCLAALTAACALAVAILLGQPPAGPETGPASALGGAAPDDVRLRELRTLDSHAPFQPPASPEAWAARATSLRRQLRVALGLWPWPARTPIDARVTRTMARDGYVVDALLFESLPGHYVTGSLYRPTSREGRLAAVLSPHGHWPGGRFQTVGDADVARALASGAEPFEVAARHPLQARAVHLARMGAIVLFLDMEGYADSQQIPEAVAHGFKSPRPHLHGPGTWGFFSPQAELHLQNVMGLQTWNVIRALDYLAARDDVDPRRIGVTGASGGGTQTFVLAALDPRPAAFFPAVMVSTRMQGGCTCENASYLRTGTTNVEIAALAAPRPLGMTAADDWTRDFERDGFPELQQVFAQLGVPGHVALRSFPQFGHNYNGPARAVMYDWFNRHLGLGFATVPAERPFVPLSRDEATVWSGGRAAPERGEAHERRLLQWMRDDAARQLAAVSPASGGSAAAFRDVVGGAVAAIVARDLPPPGSVRFDVRRRGADADGEVALGVLRSSAAGEALPAVLWPARGERRGLVVWAHPDGKAALGARAAERGAIARLREAGYDVLGLDTLEQGEFRTDGRVLDRTRQASARPHAGYTFGYNHPLPVSRAHDLLTAIRFARERAGSGEVVLVGLGAAAGWAALARATSGDAVDRLIVAPAGFRFASVDRIDHPDFLPGAAKYGDLPAMLALSAPHATHVLGDAEDDFRITAAMFGAHDRTAALSFGSRGGADGVVAAIAGR